MNRWLGVLALSILLLFAAGCGGSEPAEEAEPTTGAAATSTVAVAAATATSVPTATQAPTATASPTATTAATATSAATDTPVPTETAQSVASSCLACHADKEMLIDTAAPEEEKEPSESSGVG